MDRNTTEAFEQAFERIGKELLQGDLTMNACIYWFQQAGGARGMVPYAGFCLAQPGVGIEAMITDRSGRAVAKIRTWGREGGSPSAAYEIVDAIANFIRDN